MNSKNHFKTHTPLKHNSTRIMMKIKQEHGTETETKPVVSSKPETETKPVVSSKPVATSKCDYKKKWRMGIRDILWDDILSEHYFNHFKASVLHTFLVVHGYPIKKDDGQLLSTKRCISIIFKHQLKMKLRNHRQRHRDRYTQ